MPTVAERYKFDEVEQDGKNFFSELLKRCKLYDVEHATPESFLKLGTKDVVAGWLTSADRLLNRQQNYLINQRIHISSYKEDIIELQGKVIKAQKEALEAAKGFSECVEDSIKDGLEKVEESIVMSLETVEDSLKSGLEKSYSEVAAPTSNTVMSTEAIKTVAKQVIVEEELS